MQKAQFIICNGKLVEKYLFDTYLRNAQRELLRYKEMLKDMDEGLYDMVKRTYIRKCLGDISDLHKDTIRYIIQKGVRKYICPLCRYDALSYMDSVICERCAVVLPSSSAIERKELIEVKHKGSLKTHYIYKQTERLFLNINTNHAINYISYKNMFEFVESYEFYIFRDEKFLDLDEIPNDMVQFEKIECIDIVELLENL